MIKWILLLTGVTGLALLNSAYISDVQAKEEPTASRQHPVTSVVRIPTDIPYPPTGKSVIIVIKSGATITFKDGSLAENRLLNINSSSLEITVPSHGTVVLEGLFDNHGISPRLFFGDNELDFKEYQIIREIMATLEGGELGESEPAASGAGGGGEVFGIFQVISWFLDQIDVTTVVHAQEISDQNGPVKAAAISALDDSQLTKQLQAQMQIARALAIHRHADEYVTLTRLVRDEIAELMKGGAFSTADLDVAEAAVLQARLELEEAGFDRDLAVDRHQDLFNQRLTVSVFPNWKYTAGESLAEVMSLVPPELQSSARRYWRQALFANKTILMLESLLQFIDRYSTAYRAQFNVGRRSLNELLTCMQSRFQVQVRLVRRQYDLKTAEAWLLVAEGKLKSDVLLHPGWQ